MIENKIKVITGRVTWRTSFSLVGVPDSSSFASPGCPNPLTSVCARQADQDGLHQWSFLSSGFSWFSQRESLAGDREEYEVGVCNFQESLCRITVGWLSFCSVPSSFWPRVVPALVLPLGLAPPVYKLSFYQSSLNYLHVGMLLFPARTLTDTDGNRKPFWGSDI